MKIGFCTNAIPMSNAKALEIKFLRFREVYFIVVGTVDGNRNIIFSSFWTNPIPRTHDRLWFMENAGHICNVLQATQSKYWSFYSLYFDEYPWSIKCRTLICFVCCFLHFLIEIDNTIWQ